MLNGSASSDRLIPYLICCSSSSRSRTDNEHADDDRMSWMTLSHLSIHRCTVAASGLTTAEDGIDDNDDDEEDEVEWDKIDGIEIDEYCEEIDDVEEVYTLVEDKKLETKFKLLDKQII